MTEVRVVGVPDVIHDDLKYIAKECEGVTLSSYLKPKLKRIVRQYFEDHPDRRRCKSL